MNTNFKIHFLNTIWSDSMLLESEDHYAFVDCASKFYYPMIQDYLNKKNIKTIDFILLTHFHNDHYGNVANIINNYDVKCLYMKKYCAKEGDTSNGHPVNDDYIENELRMYDEILQSAKTNNVEIIYLDDDKYTEEDCYRIDFNGNILELYNLQNNINNVYDDESSPYYHKRMFSENNNSIIVYADINSHKIFLGSDLTESDTEATTFYRLSEKILAHIYEIHHIDYIDVYKSCHHGGGGTNKAELINLLKAKYAVITNTDKWLERWETIPNLKNANKDVKIYQTDYYQYVFDFSKDDIDVEPIESTSLFITLQKE